MSIRLFAELGRDFYTKVQITLVFQINNIHYRFMIIFVKKTLHSMSE